MLCAWNVCTHSCTDFGKSVERGEARCLCMKSARLPLIVLIFDQVLMLCWTQVNYSVSNFRLSNGINESWTVSSTSIITTMMIDSIKHNDHWQQSRMQTYLIYARVDSFHFCSADGYAVSSLPMQRTRHRAWLRKPRRHQDPAQITRTGNVLRVRMLCWLSLRLAQLCCSILRFVHVFARSFVTLYL